MIRFVLYLRSGVVSAALDEVTLIALIQCTCDVIRNVTHKWLDRYSISFGFTHLRHILYSDDESLF